VGFAASIAIRPGRLAASAPTIITEDGRPCHAICFGSGAASQQSNAASSARMIDFRNQWLGQQLVT